MRDRKVRAGLNGALIGLVTGMVGLTFALSVAMSPGLDALGSLIYDAVAASEAAAGQAAAAPRPWRIQGNLSEACTCSVPCTCNFGGAASPKGAPASSHYCYAIFSLDIRKGHWGGVGLDGLHLGAANAAKGTVWYLDERATQAQEQALRAIAHTIDAKLVAYWKSVDPKIVEDPQFTLLDFKRAKIVQEAGDKGNRLELGDAGRFQSDYLLGIDGKTPIVVENNWSWNILHGIKGRTRALEYHDEYGNRIETSASNANQGRFDWNDRTPIYLR